MVKDDEDLTPEQAAQFQKDNCIFCKIISGEIPSKKVYEDADFLGILDINPAADGHVLLLPKQHFQILPQMPQELVGNLGVACSKVSSKVIKAFKCDGTSIFIANGAVAGQRAPHFMVHIIPRKEDDKLPLNPELKEISEVQFNEVQKRIMTAMNINKKNSEYGVGVHSAKDESVVDESLGEELKGGEDGDYANNVDYETKDLTKDLDEDEIEESEDDFEEVEVIEPKKDKRKSLENTRSDSKSEGKAVNKDKLGKKSKEELSNDDGSSGGVDFDKLSRLFGK